MLAEPDEGKLRSQAQLASWSNRLDVALGALAAHLRFGEDQDVGQHSWRDERS